MTIYSQPYLGLLVPSTYFPQSPIPILISLSSFCSCYYPSSVASIVSHLLLCFYISSSFGPSPLRDAPCKTQRFLLDHSSSWFLSFLISPSTFPSHLSLLPWRWRQEIGWYPSVTTWRHTQEDSDLSTPQWEPEICYGSMILPLLLEHWSITSIKGNLKT